MEPRRGSVVYVRTSDKVLLRFPDLDTARAWLESRRLSRDDEYLAPDQTWQPLWRLFETDLLPAKPSQSDGRDEARLPSPDAGEKSSPVAAEPQRRPSPPPSLDSLKPGDAAREGPTKIAQSVGPALPTEPVNIRSIEPASTPWEADIWGTEPDAEHLRHRRRRAAWALAIAGVVVLAVASLVLVPWGRRDYPPTKVEPVPTSVATPPLDQGTLSPDVEPEPAPATSVSATAPVLDTGPASAPETLVLAPIEEPPPPPKPTIPTAPRRPAEERPGPAPTRAVSRASEDLGYDQHMIEGTRLIGHDPSKALAHFEAAARQRPGFIEPRVKMAECLYRQGRYREAAALFRQAMDRSPDYGPAIAGLARAQARLGNREEARFLYIKYLDLNPHGSHAAEARAFLGR